MICIHDICDSMKIEPKIYYHFLEESAVAKGIRRVVGITGAPAVAAQGLGTHLEQRAARLHAELAERGVDPELDAALSQLRYLPLLDAL